MRLIAAGMMLFLWSWVANCAALEVPLTVAEPIGVAREAEPISAGVPLPKGQFKDVAGLSLWDGPAEVPCQFTILTRRPDGSVMWVLLDFQASVAANGTQTLTLKDKPPTAGPGKPVEAVETAGQPAAIRTGTMEVKLAPASEPLFAEVTIGGKMAVSGLGPDSLVVKEASSGKEFRAAAPEKVAWEYRGPMRATLRVDGTFKSAAGEPLMLGYTLRLTAFAGQPRLRVEAVLFTGDKPIHIARASLGFKLQPATALPDGPKDGGQIAAGDLSVWQCYNDGTYFPDKFQRFRGEKGTLYIDLVPEFAGADKTHPGYAGGGWWMPEQARKSSLLWLEFAGQATPAAALQERLLALPPSEYVSDCEAMFFGKFGSLAEEKADYAKWGWPFKPEAVPHVKPEPGWYKADEDIHGDSETESAEGYLLMFLRTGQRGFFDRGEGWARFYKTLHVFRRPPVKLDGLAGAWGGNNVKYAVGGSRQDWAYGNGSGCHVWGWSLADYYNLTGDPDAREALLDSAEMVRTHKNSMAVKPADKALGDGGKVRYYGRQFLNVLAAYHLTGEKAWYDLAGHYAAVGAKSPAWDAEMGYWSSTDVYRSFWIEAEKQAPPELRKILDEDEAKLLPGHNAQSKPGGAWKARGFEGTFHPAYASRALYRWWQLSGDETAKKQVIALAGFGAKCALSAHGDARPQVPYWKIFDFPRKGMTVSCGFLEWKDKVGQAGWYTWHYPDLVVRGYLLTGDKKYLDGAKRMWELSSVRTDGLDRFVGFHPYLKFDEKDCSVGYAALTLWAGAHEAEAAEGRK